MTKRIEPKKILSIFSNQIFVGLILGVLSSVIVNFTTIQYQNYQNHEKFNKSLIQEINSNINSIDGQSNNGLVYIAQFQTEVWDSAVSSGEIYTFDSETILMLQELYALIKRSNDIRLISENEQWKIFYENAKNIGIAQYYEDELAKNGLSREVISDYTEKRNTALESSASLFISQEVASTIFVNNKSTENAVLKSKLLVARSFLSVNNKSQNSFYISVLSISLFCILTLLIYKTIKRISEKH